MCANSADLLLTLMTDGQFVSRKENSMSRDRLELAISQIEFARKYVLQLVEDIPESDWFREVSPCPTHLAWQVGHLAMAQYALTMLRIRGKEREDEEILSKKFFRSFQKGTTPTFDPAAYPDVQEIRDTLQRVHETSLRELETQTDESLDVPLPEPHAVFSTKLGSIFFCSAHEMLHAGQIGLWRRMSGRGPIR